MNSKIDDMIHQFVIDKVIDKVDKTLLTNESINEFIHQTYKAYLDYFYKDNPTNYSLIKHIFYDNESQYFHHYSSIDKELLNSELSNISYLNDFIDYFGINKDKWLSLIDDIHFQDNQKSHIGLVQEYEALFGYGISHVDNNFIQFIQNGKYKLQRKIVDFFASNNIDMEKIEYSSLMLNLTQLINAFTIKAKYMISMPFVSSKEDEKSYVFYHDSVDKLNRGIVNKIMPLRYISRVINVNHDDTPVKYWLDNFKYKQDLVKLHFLENNQGEEWVKLYQSQYINSCMSDERRPETVMGYALSSPYWHEKTGRKFEENGLRIAFITYYEPNDLENITIHKDNMLKYASARAIVNEKTKTYEQTYGEKKYLLRKILDKNGYDNTEYMFKNVPIAIEKDERGEYIGPYVDGLLSYGIVKEEYKNTLIVNLTKHPIDADFNMQNEDSVLLNYKEKFRCSCCDEIKKNEDMGLNYIECFSIRK